MVVFGNQNPISTCPVCGGVFRENGIRCLVIHHAGTCCHYGDTPMIASEASPKEKS